MSFSPHRLAAFSRTLAAVSLVCISMSSAHASDADKQNAADAGDLVTIDGGFAQLTFYGLLQSQIALYTGDDNLLQDGDPAERLGFRLRRARLGVNGWAWGVVDYSLSIDMSAGKSVELLDAWIGYRYFPTLGFTLGASKVPFSRFALYSSARGTLSERPLGTQALAPFRQVGLTLEGELGGLIRYAIGAYNGFERNTNFHEGYVENAGFQGNRFNRLAFAGRLELQPLGDLGKDMADLDGGGLRAGVGAGLYYSDGKTTKSAGWEIDLAVKIAGLHFIAEYIADTAEPKSVPTTTSTIPASVDRHAFTGELGYYIRPVNLGVVVRAELLDDNRDADNNGDELVLGGGVQYYWHRHHLKAMLDYTHRVELEGSDRDNQTLLLTLQFSL
ncbi:MAG: porin [Myxococcota bacterium]